MLDSSFSFMGIWSRLNGCQRLYEIYEITRWYVSAYLNPPTNKLAF
ncbi:hypothetical protein VCSRO165_2415 [Vibrio cholerae]|nr:hypothetical protein VCSRO165_2415 [Vibrio cholerae]